MCVAAPRQVFWEMTAGCNLHCGPCRRREAGRQASPAELTTEESKRLIEDLASVGQPLLVFGGGEPLWRADLFELAEYAQACGLSVALTTNGTLIDAVIADRIEQVGFDWVAISLDGADAGTHDAFRNLSGAFMRALDGLLRLRLRGLSVQIDTTVTRHNFEQLAEMRTLVERLDADTWRLFTFVPAGCGLQVPEDQRLTGPQCERVLSWIAEQAVVHQHFIRVACAPQYWRVLARKHLVVPQQLASFRPGPTKGCLAGTTICYISPTGDVFPCGYLPIPCGNIRQTSFAAIWNHSSVLAMIRNPEFLKGKCGWCEFRQTCSGCRARAYAATGDYLAEEPDCVYEPQALKA
ncbi:MAG: radical SAM protein [Armatimonadetes bacterium]|nr:radical SAM protein [Armatimonadota bacterium]